MVLNDSIFILGAFVLNIIASFCADVQLENNLAGYNVGDEECHSSPHSERIQVAIAADITHTNIHNIRTEFGSRVKEVVEAVNSIHDGSEFAITVHANWEQGAFKAAHRDPEGCYKRMLNFTTDVALIQNVATNLRGQQGPNYPQGGSRENGLSAVAFTAADSSLGWIREDIDKFGKRVRRIIVLFTDEYSIFELSNPGNRTAFKGDGTDTCSSSLPPTEEMVGYTLNKENILLIGIFVSMRSESHKLYQAFFQKYGIPQVSQTFNYGGWGRDLVEYIRNSVENQLLCVFDDPPAYNTLGL